MIRVVLIIALMTASGPPAEWLAVDQLSAASVNRRTVAIQREIPRAQSPAGVRGET